MEDYLREAVAAARLAGPGLLKYFRNLDAAQVTSKGPRDLVSIADRTSEAVILDYLQGCFPNHSFLAEESGGALQPSGFQWLIDPLDGTNNFVHGLPFFTISIALARDAQPVVGVIYDPIRDELFTAIRGGGAALNGQPIHVTPLASLSEAMLSTGFPLRARAFLDAYLRAYGALFLKAGLRRTGSAALDLAYVAAGRFDGYWDVMLMPWDYAAGALLVQEAGGKVSGFLGTPAIVSGCLLASAPGIHAEVLEILKPEFAPLLQEAARGSA